MKVGSLFSGIGGLDLGLERAGMTVVWQSEIDPYASRVLAKHWPDVPNLGDITTVDWSNVEPVDLICGGYPCQPFSYAGTRHGDARSSASLAALRHDAFATYDPDTRCWRTSRAPFPGLRTSTRRPGRPRVRL